MFDLDKAVKRGMEMFRDIQRERLTRSFTSLMTADFQTIGQPPTGVGTGIVNVEANGPQISNLQMESLDPGEYTIQFAVLDVSPATFGGVTLPQTPAPRAIINWKVNGQQLRRVISVVSGASIGGVCEAVHVKIQDQSGIFSSLVAGSTYKVVGTLSKGTRPVFMQPPTFISIPAQTIELGVFNGLTIQVPQDAGVISVFVQVVENFGSAHPLPEDIQVYFVSQGNSILGGYYPLQTPSDGWVPLPPGTFTLQIFTRQAAPNNVFVQPVWGIEG